MEIAHIRPFTILIFVALFLTQARAEPFRVDSISVEGNRRTKPWVIFRELQFSVGDTVNEAQLLRARQRLHSLSIFSDVTVNRQDTDVVAISVAELWPIIPTLGIDFPDGGLTEIKGFSDLLDKASFLVGASHLNFRGEASQLFGLYQFGSKSGVAFGYRTRWLSPSAPIAAQAVVQSFKITDRHASVLDSARTLRDTRGLILLGTREGARLGFGGEVRYEHVEQDDTTPAEGRTDDTYWISPYAKLDHRDLNWYPGRGYYGLVQTNLVTGTAEFTRSVADLRGYMPMTRFWFLQEDHRPAVLALRVAGGTSSRRTPSWAHFFSGFDSGFRGYRTVKREFANYVLEEAELRVPITHEGTYNVPMVGDYGKRIPWGFSAFFAAEHFQSRLDGVSESGFGGAAGLLIRVPYIEILEIAGERNRMGETSFTLSLGIRY